MELILLRHSITRGNLERRFMGTTDQPLAPEGEALARAVAPILPPVEEIYCSPLLRCRQTAALLWPGAAQTVVDALRETDFGPFEGKNHRELAGTPLYQAWLEGRTEVDGIPLGEDPRYCAARSEKALEDILARSGAKGHRRAAVVSHGGPLMAIMARFGRPQRENCYDWAAPNCGGWRVRAERDCLLWVLEELEGAGR
jgi:alpha-ribazole phosphatase